MAFMEAFRAAFMWAHIGVLAVGCTFIYYHVYKNRKKGKA